MTPAPGTSGEVSGALIFSNANWNTARIVTAGTDADTIHDDATTTRKPRIPAVDLSVSTINDFRAEGSETFRITLKETPGDELFATVARLQDVTTTVTIVDNDESAVTITPTAVGRTGDRRWEVNGIRLLSPV